MKNGTAKFLKFFSGTLILVCSVLSAVVNPSYESTSSILNVNNIYNVVPYKENIIKEVAMLDTGVIDTYSGTVTAYGPDCVGCIGITASGYDVRNTITYVDKEYGELRILAAANSKFPLGSIVRLSGNGIDGYIMGIVLDTGIAMRNEWSKGNVLMDLLFPTENSDDVYIFGRKKNITFEVFRYGY